MTTQATVSQHPPWPLKRTVLAAAGVVAAIQIGLLAAGNGGVLQGRLFDPDCYMHLQRALRLLTDGGWHAVLDPRINAPTGAALHWTVLFDMLLAAGAAPLRLLGFDPHTALYLWGSVVSPLLLIAALAFYAWGVRNLVKGAFFLWLTVLIFTQPEFSGGFLTGRPDHQSLVLGLFVVQLAWLYAFFEGRAHLRWAIAAGVLAGIQMCTSVEALLTILLFAGTLVLAWLVFGVRTLKVLATYLGGGAGAIFLWLLWEGGRYLFTPAYDRVSVVQLLALGSGFICFAVLAAAEDALKSRAARIGGTALAALAAAAATAVVFPGFFLGPWAHETPVEANWHRLISELQPLIPYDLTHLGMFLAQFTAALLSLPLMLSGVRRGTQAERAIMLTGLVGFVLFGGLGLMQMRWTGEMQAAILLPWTLTTRRIMQSEAAVRLGRARVPLRSFALSGAFLLQMLSMAFSYGGMPDHIALRPAEACPWRRAIEALRPIAPPGGIVMTELWQGPEILWRTKLRVVGGPYEIADALTDTYAFMDGNERAAHQVVERRGIGFVLVCKRTGGAGFGGALAKGAAPNWLSPVPLPAGARGFRLYRVAPD